MKTAAATYSQKTQLGTFKTNDVPTNCLEGLPAEELEAITKSASDGTLWNSTEDFKCPKADADRKRNKVTGHGIWITVNPNDPRIIDLGNFAVTEFNRKTGTNLGFLRVVSGLQLHIRAINFYALVIGVQDGQTRRDCNALIFEVSLGFRQLLLCMDN